MQLGFVIDHSKCIGCHACTVACKSENDVPLGSFRTWVKYTEAGTFPEVKRSFAVLRCNQCTDAPCVTICPVNALAKRPDGIVDVDPARCIGCKACMQGCPYDALYLNGSTGTAEKCHFCAHRTELGLAPACAVVCPTEAIVPGDFHDPESAVSKLRREHPLRARKTEAGTGPNVLYREVDEAGIDPLGTSGAGGYLWAGRRPGPRPAAEAAVLEHAEVRARTTYNVDHPVTWGRMITAYLFFKSLAAGAFLAAALAWLTGGGAPPAVILPGLAAVALGFLVVTTVALVGDLKRPERFFTILTRPNWNSWLARGSFLLVGYGLALTVCLGLILIGIPVPGIRAAVAVTALLAVLSAAYTGWLFGQARGRVLWMRRGLWIHLVVQALAAGFALALLLGPELGLADRSTFFRLGLAAALFLHAVCTALEGRGAPPRRRAEYERTLRLITRGPFKREHVWGGWALGVMLPGLLLAVPGSPVAWGVASVAALLGLWIEEDLLVRAGQALPIS